MFVFAWFYFLFTTVHQERERYAFDSIDTHHGLPHWIRRSDIFEDVTSLYNNKSESLFQEYPFRGKFVGEKAVDTGGCVGTCSVDIGMKRTKKPSMAQIL